MKIQNMILRYILFFLCFYGTLFSGKSQQREFFILEIIEFTELEQRKSADQFLKDVYIPALKRQELQNIGVFKSRLNELDSVPKTYILYSIPELNKIDRLKNNLAMDREFMTKGSNFLAAPYDNAAFKRYETIVLKAFADMPKLRPTDVFGQRSERVYELRSYESATIDLANRKVDMFNAGGEIALFEKLEFNAVFYGEVFSGPRMPNLMYMTTFENMKSRDEHWEKFRNDPEWETMKSMDKYANTVSHIDIYLLYPTEYSDY